ncbi:MAG: hypothetical protein COA42_11355 [Alteromonadaceae bacterium]|nr:MAG: hypothetical protein COA42_11355 [Alteromonadaceae bacterium]
MKTKSSAHYQREFRRRLRDLGLVKKEVWILPENAGYLAEYEKLLRHKPSEQHQAQHQRDLISKKGEVYVSEMKRWTTSSLYEALQENPLFDGEQASVELIDGVEPAIHIIMHEFGDLPLFLIVMGDQIIVDAVLWPVQDVANLGEFNDTVLRTHKYFPLSTISLDTLPNGKDYYQMFGALSAMSILPNVIFEIEVLASNVIQATEAYGHLLKNPVSASI